MSNRILSFSVGGKPQWFVAERQAVVDTPPDLATGSEGGDRPPPPPARDFWYQITCYADGRGTILVLEFDDEATEQSGAGPVPSPDLYEREHLVYAWRRAAESKGLLPGPALYWEGMPGWTALAGNAQVPSEELSDSKGQPC